MRNLKIAAIVTLLAIYVTGYILFPEYYQRAIESFTSYASVSGFGAMIRNFFMLAINLLELTLCFVFLFASQVSVRDKAYRLLRFFYVMNYLLYLPITIFFLFLGDHSMTWTFWYSIGARLAGLFVLIVFLVAKPERPINRINLADYELVSYTSASHRFVHYLLDILFLLPILLGMIDYAEYGYGDDVLKIIANIMYYGVFFFYYFLSEAIFRQTFGKIITNSCVVSAGPDLTTGRVLLRTICRYIPFDAFSFFGSAKWHDKFSATEVVYIDSWEKVFEEVAPAEQSVERVG